MTASDAIKNHWVRVLAGNVWHSQRPEEVTIIQNNGDRSSPIAILESPKQPVKDNGTGQTIEAITVFVLRDPDAELDGTAIGGVDEFSVGCILERADGSKYTFQGRVLDLAESYQVVVFERRLKYSQGRGR